MTSTLQFEPIIPPALWLILAAVGIGLTIWYARARPTSATSRAWYGALGLWMLGLLGVLLVLLNPIWLEQAPPPAGKPSLTILVDSSSSMAVKDGGTNRSRFAQATEAAQKLMSQSSTPFEVRLATFAENTKPTDAAGLAAIVPSGDVTDLAAAIRDNLDADRPQGQALALLSDGIHNASDRAGDVTAAVRAARGMDVPIYTWTFGGAANVRDLAVDLESQQEIAFIDQQAPIVVRVRQTGLALSKTEVSLVEGKEVVGKAEAVFNPSGAATATFLAKKSKVGVAHYAVRVATVPGEATPVNNEATFLLRVVDKPIKVLLLEGKPYWDGKFLVRTLTSDPSIELDAMVVMAPGRILRRTVSHRKPAADSKSSSTGGEGGAESWKIVTNPAEALAAKTLEEYQVVVLGRNADVFLSDASFEQLRQWIARDSGSLVCYRGSPMARVQQQMSRLLPVKWEPANETRFRPRLTDRGREARWLSLGDGSSDDGFNGLPTLSTTNVATPAGPLSVVLATAGGENTEAPAVAYQPYGGGRVVAIEGAGMWRWAFLPPQQKERDGAYAGLWRNLLRWLASNAGLAPGQKSALRSDKVTFRTSEEASATLLTRETGSPRKIVLTGGSLAAPRTVSAVPSGDAPGVFRLPFGKLPEGLYRAGIEGEPSSETAFDVRRLTDEQLDLAARPALMARIAAESGGATLDASGGDELAKHFRGRRATGSLERVTRTPAWDRWWALAAVVAAWAGAWRIRRASGLV